MESRCSRTTSSSPWTENPPSNGGPPMAEAMNPAESGTVLGGAVDGITNRTPRHKTPWAKWLTLAGLAVLSTAFFLYLLVPIVAMLVHAPPQDIWHEMTQPDVRAALALSFVTTAISTVLAV